MGGVVTIVCFSESFSNFLVLFCPSLYTIHFLNKFNNCTSYFSSVYSNQYRKLKREEDTVRISRLHTSVLLSILFSAGCSWGMNIHTVSGGQMMYRGCFEEAVSSLLPVGAEVFVELSPDSMRGRVKMREWHWHLLDSLGRMEEDSLGRWAGSRYLPKDYKAWNPCSGPRPEGKTGIAFASAMITLEDGRRITTYNSGTEFTYWPADSLKSAQLRECLRELCRDTFAKKVCVLHGLRQ